MNGLVSEPLGELLGLLLSVIAAGALTVVGVVTESAAMADLVAGQSVIGLWELWMGLLALYAGVYLLGYERVWNRLRQAESPSN